MNTLDIFLCLFILTLTDMQKAVLNKCLIDLYKLFGITWETDIHFMETDDFPAIKEWYDLILSKVKTEENGQRYSNLAMLLYDMAEGADSFIRNGYSTVPVHEETRMMVLDTLALLEMSESIKRTLTFLLPLKSLAYGVNSVYLRINQIYLRINHCFLPGLVKK
ncbi:hypothetical protein [Eisenbergiella porci]|uniref:hypothetical protein n=1 Tax=Eisenbergiella porci TaxID=2652274 RepID=UPI002A7FF57B|nr:hypothetical protein [Eisenbergiella porci]